MPKRHVRRSARERAVQFLFGLEFTKAPWNTAIDIFWEVHPARPSVKRYARELIQGVSDNMSELDSAISGALEHWSMDRVGRIELNVLRVALFEMRYTEDVPRKVAINEAIEISKKFGADEAPRFVNGVLDRLEKEDIPRPNDS